MNMILLHIPGVPGDCALPGFEGQIELLSFSHGISMPVTGNAGDVERTSGRPHVAEFTVTRHVSRATPLLNLKCCEAADLGEVVVTAGRNDNGAVVPLLVYTLSNVIISLITVSGGGPDDRPMESLSFNYTGIRWEYMDNGDPRGPASSSWDLAANRGK